MKIIFDLDDTLVATRKYIIDTMIEQHDHKFDLKKMEFIRKLEMSRNDKHPLKYLGKDGEAYIEEFIGNKSFMTNSEIVSWVNEGETKIREELDYLNRRGHSLGICTHRGGLSESKELSFSWLFDHYISSAFESYDFVDASEYPNKLVYLQSLYGDDFILIDDCPLREEDLKNTDPKLLDNLIVCRTEHEFLHLSHLKGFRNKDGYKKLLAEELAKRC